VAIGVYAWSIWTLDENLYYLAVQEDEYLEWASFWAFFAAACVYLRKTFKPSFQLTRGWFLLGLAAFCLFVALEEVSWGQRILGYRPPDYFLESNYQQELNVHNVVDTDLRKLALQLVIFGYGVALPLVMLVPVVSEQLRRLGIVAPPPALIPAFLFTGIGQVTYPIKFTGEWVELMLGLGFLFSALSLSQTDPTDSRPRRLPLAGRLSIVWLAILIAGVASATVTRYQRDRNPDNATAARLELEALKRDIVSGQLRTRCGPHKRLYTYALQYRQSYLFTGEFSQLTQQGLPEPRAAYLLDPWNYAYWVRDNCATDERERMTYLYSFGPNRRRDSTKWELGGDDIAVFIRGEP